MSMRNVGLQKQAVGHTPRMEPWRERFRERFYELEKSGDITRASLAERLECSRARIDHFINGVRSPRSLSDYEKLARAVGLHPAYMCFGVPVHEPDFGDAIVRLANMHPEKRHAILTMIRMS